jgi:hypothetical protein
MITNSIASSRGVQVSSGQCARACAGGALVDGDDEAKRLGSQGYRSHACSISITGYVIHLYRL